MDQRVHFLTNCCHTCKQLQPSFECEICHMVYYCSEKDRRDNWQAHSQLCRALYKLCQAKGVERIYENAVNCSVEAFRDIRHAVAMDCAKFLGRSLDSWELEIIYWPKVCSVCFQQTGDLTACNECGFVFSCSEMHFKKNHSFWCETLKLYCEIVRHVEKKGVPLSTDLEICSDVGSMAEILRSASNSTVNRAFLSELLTYPLTVHRVLKTFLSQDENFVIHIVGAELQAEVLPFSKWEKYFLHLLPKAKHIDLIFIGPDLQQSEGISLKSDIDLCQNCRNAGKRLSYQLECNTVYHEYLQKPSATKPNLITALNAGLYRMIGFQGKDTWTPTLSKIFEQPAPVLITEYTSFEINQDLSLISKKFPKVKIKEQPGENPFASVKPNLNIISDEETPVIFKNYFSMLLQVDD